MSLGLFNCRLIQPAGDQLFFLSTVLPHRCPFARVLFSLLVTHPARPRPAGGRRMLFVFPSQKDFVLAFRRGEVPSGAERFTPTDSPANFPEDPPILPIDSAIEPELVGRGVGGLLGCEFKEVWVERCRVRTEPNFTPSGLDPGATSVCVHIRRRRDRNSAPGASVSV